jgi:hypothetical protein
MFASDVKQNEDTFMKHFLLLFVLFSTHVYANELSDWDLERLAEKGAHLKICSSASKWHYSDIGDMAEAARRGRKGGAVTMIINNNKYDDFDIRLMAQDGVRIQVHNQSTGLDCQDLPENSANNAASFSYFDLQSLAKYGPVHIYASTTTYSAFDLENIIASGQVVLHVDKKNKFSDFDLRDMVQAGAKVIINTKITQMSRFDLETLLDVNSKKHPVTLLIQ